MKMIVKKSIFPLDTVSMCMVSMELQILPSHLGIQNDSEMHRWIIEVTWTVNLYNIKINTDNLQNPGEKRVVNLCVLIE